MYVDTPTAKKFYGVSKDTLRRWSKKGKIDFIRTKGNHRRYFIPDKQQQQFAKIIYARVSSAKQKEHLNNQVKFLQNKFPEYTVIRDVGSGINYERKGFRTILEQVFQRNVREVVVATKDRFTRFGFDLFQFIFERFGASLNSIDSIKCKSQEQELAEDLLAIVTVFTAKYHGKRKYSKSNKKNKDLSKQKAEKVLQ